MVVLLIGLTFVIAFALGSGAFNPAATNNRGALNNTAGSAIGSGVGFDGVSDDEALEHLANRVLPGNNDDPGNRAPRPRPDAGAYLPDAIPRTTTSRDAPLTLDPAAHAFALVPPADAVDAADELPLALVSADIAPGAGAAHARLAPVVRAGVVMGASVRGRVVDAMMRPIRNAQISVRVDAIDSTASVIAAATIDDSGAFTIDGIAPGAYRLTIAHELFDTRHVPVTVGPLDVALDVGTYAMEVNARWAGVLTVGVRESGEVVVDARLQLRPIATRDGSGRALDARTNAAGLATFTGLLPGRYQVSVLGPRNSAVADDDDDDDHSASLPVERGRAIVHVVPPAAANGVIGAEPVWIALTTAGEIAGAVTGPDGEAVVGAEVVLVQTDTGRSDVLAITNAGGRYRATLTADQTASLPTARLYARDAGYRWYSEPREGLTAADTDVWLSLSAYAARGRRAIVTGQLDFGDLELAAASSTSGAAQIAIAFTPDDATSTGTGPAPLIALERDGRLTIVEFGDGSPAARRRLVIIAPGIGAFSRTITLPAPPAARADGRLQPLRDAPAVDIGALRLTRGVMIEGRAFALDNVHVGLGDSTAALALPDTQTFERLANGMIIATAAPLRVRASADGAYKLGPLPVGSHRIAVAVTDRADSVQADRSATRLHDLWVYVKPSLLTSAESPAETAPRVRIDFDTTALAGPLGDGARDVSDAGANAADIGRLLLGTLRLNDRPAAAGTLVAIALDGDAIAFVTTDAAGRVTVSDPRLTALDAISIDRRVRFHLAGAPWPVTATRATVSKLEDGSRLRDVVLHGLPILGRINREGGGPIDGTTVALLDSDWRVRQVARPMRGDALAIDHVPWGDWEIELALPADADTGTRRVYRLAVSVPEDNGVGAPRTRVAVATTLALGRGRLVGHVVDALDQPVPRATVVVRWRPSDGERPDESGPYMSVVRADDDGRFAVDGLRAGHYVIHNVPTAGAPLGLTPVVVLADIGPSVATLKLGLAGAAQSLVRLTRAGADVLADDTALALGPMGARLTLAGPFGFALPAGVIAGDPADWLGIAATTPGLAPIARLPVLPIDERFAVYGHIPGLAPVQSNAEATGAPARTHTLTVPHGQSE